MIDADRMNMLIETHLQGDRVDHRAMLEAHDVDPNELTVIALSNAETAVATDTNLGVAAVFMQGVQLGLLLADYQAGRL